MEKLSRLFGIKRYLPMDDYQDFFSNTDNHKIYDYFTGKYRIFSELKNDDIIDRITKIKVKKTNINYIINEDIENVNTRILNLANLNDRICIEIMPTKNTIYFEFEFIFFNFPFKFKPNLYIFTPVKASFYLLSENFSKFERIIKYFTKDFPK